jgi:hypothetical protein
MSEQPLLILGCERREVRNPMMTGYCWSLLIGSFLCCVVAVIAGLQTPEQPDQELLGTERQHPIEQISEATP